MTRQEGERAERGLEREGEGAERRIHSLSRSRGEPGSLRYTRSESLRFILGREVQLDHLVDEKRRRLPISALVDDLQRCSLDD